jgi:hypothetical protein
MKTSDGKKMDAYVLKKPEGKPGAEKQWYKMVPRAGLSIGESMTYAFPNARNFEGKQRAAVEAAGITQDKWLKMDEDAKAAFYTKNGLEVRSQKDIDADPLLQTGVSKSYPWPTQDPTLGKRSLYSTLKGLGHSQSYWDSLTGKQKKQWYDQFYMPEVKP